MGDRVETGGGGAGVVVGGARLLMGGAGFVMGGATMRDVGEGDRDGRFFLRLVFLTATTSSSPAMEDTVLSLSTKLGPEVEDDEVANGCSAGATAAGTTMSALAGELR